MSEIEFIHRSPKENLDLGEYEGDPIHTVELIVDGKTVGDAELKYYSKPFPLYEVGMISIEPEEQGKGYGSDLMTKIESMLQEKGKAGVLVDAIDDESGALGMYQRRGWQKVPDSHDHYLYAFNLPKNTSVEKLIGYQVRNSHTKDQEYLVNIRKQNG